MTGAVVGWMSGMVLWFNEDDVLARAGAVVVDRAAEFGDAVSITVSAGEIVSTVGYDQDFDVRVTGANGRLVGECSCGKRTEDFCEHCVAAALMALDVASPPDPDAPRLIQFRRRDNGRIPWLGASENGRGC